MDQEAELELGCGFGRRAESGVNVKEAELELSDPGPGVHLYLHTAFGAAYLSVFSSAFIFTESSDSGIAELKLGCGFG
jgi:hypothetical protein